MSEKNFEHVGVQGSGASSTAMRDKGMKQFTEFLKEKNMPPWSDLTPAHITIELVQEFGGYLCFEAEKEDGELFAWESISKFISGFKGACLNDTRFKNLEIWKENNANWYSRVRDGCYRILVLRCIAEGKPLSSKSTPLMRESLRVLMACCIAIDCDSMVGGEKRWAFANAFHAVGRTGEISDATWRNSFWDPDHRIPFVLWNERKVARQAWLNFFADYDCYELCWFHCLACYLILGGGSSTYVKNKGISTSGQSDIEFLEDPLCPELSHLKSESVPSAISRWLKTVTLSAPNFKDAEGNAMYEIPAGVTGRLMSE